MLSLRGSPSSAWTRAPGRAVNAGCPAQRFGAHRPGVGLPGALVQLALDPWALRLHALPSPQEIATRQTATGRRASATRAWLCASRGRGTTRSIATTSTSTARAPPPTAASMSRPRRRPVAPPPRHPLHCPSALWGLTEKKGGSSCSGDQTHGTGRGGGGSGAYGLPCHLLPGALQQGWSPEDSGRPGP